MPDSDDKTDEGKVSLMTIHAAKGLEHKMVFIVSANEGYLPISYAKSDAQVAEEQRLFYVALTRAKDTLSVTWHKTDVNDSRVRMPSRFINLAQPGF